MGKIIGIVVVIVLVVGGIMYFRNNRGEESVAPSPTETAVPNTEAQSVNYDGKSYTPDSITIAAGTTVIFKNVSEKEMWPASAFHPTHGEYPVAGGCVGSTFDACDRIKPNMVWSFQFDEKGTWGYHDHINPGAKGTIIVQ